MSDRIRIPYTGGVFELKVRVWRYDAGVRHRPFILRIKPGNWKEDRLFHCGHCEEHAVVTGRKKAACPGCRKRMTLMATETVAYEDQLR